MKISENKSYHLRESPSSKKTKKKDTNNPQQSQQKNNKSHTQSNSTRFSEWFFASTLPVSISKICKQARTIFVMV